MHGSRRPLAGLHRARPRLALALALGLALQLPALAADITVGGGCTLVDAITAANTDTATGGCSAGFGSDKVILTGDVTLTAVNNTDLSGPSGLPVVISDITVEGNDFEIARDPTADSFRIFKVEVGGRLILQNTTLRNGGGPGFTSHFGGGIFAFGITNLFDSTVTGCSAMQGGGVAASSSSFLIFNSTISNNHAVNTGGGIEAGVSTGVANSTISGNTAGGGSGGGINIPLASGSISFSTLISNTGAISGDVFVTGSLLANSTGANCSGTITDGGGNLSTDDSCGTIPPGLTGLDPVLADNGGPTLTHALLAGSNAIDNAGSCGFPTDQRGFPRDDGACDSGSFEYSEPVCTLLELKDDTITDSQSYDCTEIHLGPNLAVMGPSGVLTVTAETQVVFFDDVEVRIDGELTAGNAPNP